MNKADISLYKYYDGFYTKFRNLLLPGG